MPLVIFTHIWYICKVVADTVGEIVLDNKNKGLMQNEH